MNGASPADIQVLRPQILERRARLQAAATRVSPAYVHQLLDEIDAALGRIDNGVYGICETCHDPIEPDRLQVDPMVRFCLDHLTQREMQAHEQDLQLAYQIQSRLLPPAKIAIEPWEAHYRYQPAGPVGGDYCELAPLANRQSLFFAVGDVAGKGVAASLLMTHLTAILRGLLALDLPLADMMSRANRMLCESTIASHYATLVCGRTSGDGVELCNAGHCPPLLLRQESIERLDSSGLPLGLFCNAEYAVMRSNLAPGDSLVLYSDGLTEAEDPHGDLFGENRLSHSLRRYSGGNTEAMAEGVLLDVAHFRGARGPSDDLTLSILRRVS